MVKFNLSDKRIMEQDNVVIDKKRVEFYYADLHVKEFIKRAKGIFRSCGCGKGTINEAMEEIDKLAGDKLK